jgi:hypothetical protein
MWRAPMTDWRKKILEKVAPQDYKLVVAVDPDGLLQEEEILSAIKERGFEVIPFDDPVTFRYIYESEYRQKWDKGQETENAVLLHSRGSDPNAVPYDLLKAGKLASISIDQIFPKLSYPVVEKLGREYFDDLFEAYKRYRGGQVGETKTKEFILENVFGINPNLIRSDVDLFRTLFSVHYRNMGIPEVLLDHLTGTLEKNFQKWPLGKLFSSRAEFFNFVNEGWSTFLTSLVANEPYEIPFEHEEIRVYVNTLFLEGRLEPIEFPEHSALPEWVKIGIKIDPISDKRKRFHGLLSKLMEELPGEDSRYRAWQNTAVRWAELVVLRYSLGKNLSKDAITRFAKLQDRIEAAFKTWTLKKLGSLPNLAYLPKPVMVHHIPHYIASKIDGQNKIALIVIDGLALDQWLIIKDTLNSDLDWAIEEDVVFAWAPTLTSISRQAIFSGESPRMFVNTILSTNAEEKHWQRFWMDRGQSIEKITYMKGLKLNDKAEILSILKDPRKTILGLVVNTVDEFMHHAQLGVLEMHKQVRTWLEEGYLKQLITELLSNGFEVYITSDHGNVSAVGQGKPQQEGVLVEGKGKRVRIYDSPAFRDRVADQFHDTLKWSTEYLSGKYYALIADGQTAFMRKGEKVVAHGGISLEEIMVPLIRICGEKR